jgi:hypothetical protein
MNRSKLNALLTAGAVAALVLGYAGSTVAQTRAPYAGALTPGGVPNLEGAWTYTSLTRMERPVEFGTRSVMTDKEVADLEGSVRQTRAAASAPTPADATTEDIYKASADCHPLRGNCNYNDAWVDPGTYVNRINGEPRTSLITYPANGRIPWKNGPPPRDPNFQEEKADNPEDLRLSTRCVLGFGLMFGSIFNAGLYNNNMQISQGPEAVALVSEAASMRIARLNAQHWPAALPRWFGDPVARYEGDTLVVETTNFHPLQRDGAGPKLKVTERFTRVGPNRLLYRFHVEDPDTFTQPWGGEQELMPTQRLYEFACHEGNYGLQNILAGARADEKSGVVRASGPSLLDGRALGRGNNGPPTDESGSGTAGPPR